MTGLNIRERSSSDLSLFNCKRQLRILGARRAARGDIAGVKFVKCGRFDRGFVSDGSIPKNRTG